MKFAKNIIFVSYLKNKGIRRICFILSCCSMLYFSVLGFTLSRGYYSIDETYHNFQSFNSDIYMSYKIGEKGWYKKIECASKYLKQYGFAHYDAYNMVEFKNILNRNSLWCQSNEVLCKRIEKIKDYPIHLKCGAFETYDYSNAQGFLIYLIFIIISFYLPFVLCVFAKLTYKALYGIIEWIIKGFKENT